MGFDLGAHKGPVRPSMNVTPLVDVVLVLLIIFMVITPMMVKQMSVNVPVKDDKAKQADAEPPDSDQEPQIVLTVRTDGYAYINKLKVADEHLGTRLKRVFAARADQTLFFDAADNVPYGRATAVLDIARGIGLSTIAVLTEPIAN